MVKAAISTCIKNEHEYLECFIKYHLDLGVNEIYIFEDYGSDSHKEICDRYEQVYLYSVLDLFDTDEEKQEVIQMRIEKIPSQTLYINQMLAKLYPTHNENWFVFLIDIDEYITCTQKFPDILERYKDYDAIQVYWQNFGCSGHIYKPAYDKPIYEIYTERCGFEIHKDLKYSNITKFCVNMHKWKPTMMYKIHNALVNWVKIDFTTNRKEIVYEPLYLRHYITKSWEEYLWKILIRSTFHITHRNYQSFFEMCPEMEDKIRNDKDFKNYFYNKYGVMPDY